MVRAAMRVWACAGLAAVISVASPADARTVEYLNDLTAIRAAADDQAIAGPFSETPGPGNAEIVLETPTAADHRVITASVYCQAYHIDNPVSLLLQDLVAATNRQRATAVLGTATGPTLGLRIVSGSTLLRCMAKDDLQATCKNRVRLTAEATFTGPDGTLSKVPVVAQVERVGRVGGFCGNIARYTGIVTREAAIDLIRQARAVSGG